jgi:hypothetical protein
MQCYRRIAFINLGNHSRLESDKQLVLFNNHTGKYVIYQVVSSFRKPEYAVLSWLIHGFTMAYQEGASYPFLATVSEALHHHAP